MASPLKLTDEQRDGLIEKLLEFHQLAMAANIKRDAENLALRAAVIKLAELQPELARIKFAKWIGETEKHFHHELLKGLENKDPFMAAFLDNRKMKDM